MFLRGAESCWYLELLCFLNEVPPYSYIAFFFIFNVICFTCFVFCFGLFWFLEVCYISLLVLAAGMGISKQGEA